VRLLESFASFTLTALHTASPRLQLAAEQYHKSISKKKVPVSLDEPDKLLPREAFGITMVHHGEDFAEDSLFGTLSYVLSALFNAQTGCNNRTGSCEFWACIL
jgi:hypothetical protein